MNKIEKLFKEFDYYLPIDMKNNLIDLIEKHSKYIIEETLKTSSEQAHFRIKAKTGQEIFQEFTRNDFSITIDKPSILNLQKQLEEKLL